MGPSYTLILVTKRHTSSVCVSFTDYFSLLFQLYVFVSETRKIKYQVNLLYICANKSFYAPSQSEREVLYRLYVHKCTLTWGLEIECDQLGAAEPHGKRVVVRWVQPLSSGINSGKLKAVVLQEAFPPAASRKLLCLCFWEGRHVPVTRPLRPYLWKQQQITRF